MKYNDHEFDPVTDEERAAREREEELARRIRREVLRVQSGEADEEIRADREREQASICFHGNHVQCFRLC